MKKILTLAFLTLLFAITITGTVTAQEADASVSEDTNLNDSVNQTILPDPYNTRTGESFTTIQAAIDDVDTENGDTIEVEPGIYSEHVILNKMLNLIATGPNTIINGTLTITALGNGSTVRGFTITNGTTTSTTIFSENFEDVTTPGLPSGWATIPVYFPGGTEPKWQTNAGTVHPSGNPAHSGTNLAYFNSYSTSDLKSARLYRTIGLDLSGSSSAELAFWMFHDVGYLGANDQIQVQISTDGGNTWNNVGSPFLRDDGTVGWMKHTLNIASFTGSGMTDVRIGFLGISGFGNDCNIDDVTIDTLGTGRLVEVEFGANNVILEDLTITGGTANVNGAGIYNQGGNAAQPTQMINCLITGNTATGNYVGGGIYNTGTLNMVNCEVTSNTARHGGGIYNNGMLTVNFSRIVGNTPQAIYNVGTVSSLEDNWWGSNVPDFTSLIYGATAPYNWLYMTINATPSTINNTQTSLITVSFNNRYNGTTVTPYTPGVGEYIPDGTPVTFSLTNGPFGTLTVPFTANTIGGIASILFTATNVGVQDVNGSLDDQKVTTSITILAAHVDLETFYADYNEFVNNNHNIVIITDPVTYLDRVVVAFTATNMGPNPVTNLVLREDWPSELIGTGDVWHTFDGINWILESFFAHGSFNLYPTYAGPLNVGDVCIVVFGATVHASNTIITNTVSTIEQDPIDVEGFDTASADLEVNQCANITITKTGPHTIIAGNQITYTITATNNGPDHASDVIISDTFPVGISDISWNAEYSGGASGPTSGTGNLNINLGTLPAGGSCTITVNGTVPSSTPKDTTLSNTVTITSSTPITDPTRATDTVTTTVEKESDIELSKTVDNPRPNVGETVTYTVSVHNNGPSDANDIQIGDIMPSDFTEVMITPSKGTYDEGTGIWALNLTSGESATLTLLGKVSSIMAGKNTTNIATLLGTTNQTNATIYVPKADLYIQITSNNNNPTVGETFTLTYKLGNNGPDDAVNVIITIPLPDGFVISSISGDGTWTINGNTITWTMKNVTVGDPYLYISGRTTGPGIYLFNASITSNTFSINSRGVSSLTLNAVPQVNAATPTNTVGMQKTGIPLAGIVLAILMALGGFIGTRKKQ